MLSTITTDYERTPNGFVGVVPEIPGAIVHGDSIQEADEQVDKAIETMFQANRDLAKEVSAPGCEKRTRLLFVVKVPELLLRLYQAAARAARRAL